MRTLRRQKGALPAPVPAAASRPVRTRRGRAPEPTFEELLQKLQGTSFPSSTSEQQLGKLALVLAATYQGRGAAPVDPAVHRDRLTKLLVARPNTMKATANVASLLLQAHGPLATDEACLQVVLAQMESGNKLSSIRKVCHALNRIRPVQRGLPDTTKVAQLPQVAAKLAVYAQEHREKMVLAGDKDETVQHSSKILTSRELLQMMRGMFSTGKPHGEAALVMACCLISLANGLRAGDDLLELRAAHLAVLDPVEGVGPTPMVPMTNARRGGKQDFTGSATNFSFIRHWQPELDAQGALSVYVVMQYMGTFSAMVQDIRDGIDRWMEHRLLVVRGHTHTSASDCQLSYLIKKWILLLVGIKMAILHLWRYTGVAFLILAGLPQSEINGWGRWATEDHGTMQRCYAIKCPISSMLGMVAIAGFDHTTYRSNHFNFRTQVEVPAAWVEAAMPGLADTLGKVQAGAGAGEKRQRALSTLRAFQHLGTVFWQNYPLYQQIHGEEVWSSMWPEAVLAVTRTPTYAAFSEQVLAAQKRTELARSGGWLQDLMEAVARGVVFSTDPSLRLPAMPAPASSPIPAAARAQPPPPPQQPAAVGSPAPEASTPLQRQRPTRSCATAAACKCVGVKGGVAKRRCK